MDEQRHQALIKKLVANARAIISDQIGLSIGARKMSNILNWLAPFEKVNIEGINIFQKYDEETQYIPSGTARLYCSKDAFEKYDAQLEEVNQKFRKEILEICFEIIEIYGDRKSLKL